MARLRTGGGADGAGPKLAVAGHVNIDHHFAVDRLPAPDRTVAVRRRHSELGGTAANLARAARRAGVRVGIVSRVGTDFPAPYRALLTREGIDLAGLESVAGAATPSCVIVHDERGAQMTFIDQGPMGDAARAPIPERFLAACRWVHLGTGDPAYLARLQQWSRAHGVRVALDPAQEIHYRWSPDQLRAALGHAELFFGNEAEVDRARRLLSCRSVEQLTELVPVIVVTRGSRGADAYARGGRVRIPGVRVRGVTDPTGAGDAFRGGFYAGWLRGEALADCLSAGARSASDWLTARHAAARGASR